MVHEMNVRHKPFRKIKDGSKTIEMRLYDEKRSRIKTGDTIIFTDVHSGEKIKCFVSGLFIYEDFDELYRRHDQLFIGYDADEEASPFDMLAYYSPDEMKTFGVVAIEIQLI